MAKDTRGKAGAQARENAPLPELAPDTQYPDWVYDLVGQTGLQDLSSLRLDDLAAAGIDVSDPGAWQSGLQQLQSSEQVADQKSAQDTARNDRFGDDMAWLDLAFQQEAATVAPATTADAARIGLSADPRAMAEQASLLGEIRGRGTTADAEAEAAQQTAVDELLGLYRQGGQSAQDKAARARARADSENLLQGQRQADIQDRAERGMSGSGGEVLDLLADRQAAASRLSAADLETDAAAEKRALEALLGAEDVASGMRDASDRYQDANTRAASDLATGMRQDADAFVGGNADRLNDASALNAKMINDASGATKKFLQDAYQNTMDRRDRWDRGLLDTQTEIATGTRAFDASQNNQGYGTTTDVATGDVNRQNDARDNYNRDELGIHRHGTDRTLDARNRAYDATGDFFASANNVTGEGAKTMASMGAGGMGGGAGGMGGFGAMGGAAMGGTGGGVQQPRRSNIVDPWEAYG